MDDSKYTLGILTERRDVSSDLWVVRIRPREPIPFTAGQYVTVGLPVNGRMVERAYSVASAPDEPELELFIELVPQGQLTPPLHAVPTGSDVFVRRVPKGRFLFDQKSGRRNHFMVATVTGVAPFVSMLRTLVARAGQSERIQDHVVLLHGASISQEFGYHEELAVRARQHDWFHYLPTVSRVWLDPEWTGEIGRCEDVVRKHLDAFGLTPANTTGYVCGNPAMIRNVKGVFQRAGFPKESVKEEAYWVAAKAA
jgi:ferredoxin--NADP+ reductase